MKIAVTYENGSVFMHFGHTEYFMMYEVKDNKITNNYVVSTNGEGHGQIASFLKRNNVDVVICGGIGGPAVKAVESLGISVYSGACGDVNENVMLYLDGKLKSRGIANCHHHDHDNEDENQHNSCSSCESKVQMSMKKNVL